MGDEEEADRTVSGKEASWIMITALGFKPIFLDSSREKSVTATLFPSVMFRGHRLVISTDASLPTWVCWLYRLFLWFRFPWLLKRWDENEERNRYRFLLISPASYFYSWMSRRTQDRALRNVRVWSLRVNDSEQLCSHHPLPALMFSPTDCFSEMSLDACPIGGKISVSLIGKSENEIHVVLLGVT